MYQALKDGISLYKQKKYTEALAFFLTVPDGDEEASLEIAYYLALCYMQLKKNEEAILYFEQVVTTASDLGRVRQARFLLAVLYSKTGRNRLADFELKKLIESGRQDEKVFSSLAYVSWIQGDSESSIRYYERALELNPEYPSALNGLGYVLASLDKDLARALSLCKRAHDYNSSSAAFLDSVAWAYYKLGFLKEAKSFIKKAKRIDSLHPDIIAHYEIIFETKEAAK
ncbi:MAG TPA: tetratricopeptide repeat protein [Treponemataceae bacterium]|jgi:tetratricopeptide (TPR) repeat protein|nr:tetratricopeptide repeat protein [Spirochaetota bacterium]HBG36968.1 hypothetical protein [Treponema sp.]HOQ92960.1 tetratricopeptide repeat protein [Treponemataceae bacterium]HPM05906.1 tetratricopeptide repeat protein [Treponemataceae bacterium]HUH44912.1 tetratricopeptide repeat protein [Treponemataceae bacterium]